MKKLHLYLGTDTTDQDFLVYLLPRVMSPPENEKEIKEDDEDKYYPYSGIGTDVQNAYLVYSGNRVMPKTRARKIKAKFKPDELKTEIFALSNESKEELAAWMTDRGRACSFANVSEAICDYLKFMIWSMAGAETELITIASQNPAISQSTECNESYGAFLASEANNNCLFPGCTNKLYIRAGGHIRNNYDVIILNENQSNDDPDNMMALCPECAMKYRYSVTPEIWEKLMDAKLKAQDIAEAEDLLARDDVVNGLQSIIDMIPQIPLEGLADLSFNPKTIKEKMDGTDLSLTRKIVNKAAQYYKILDEQFKNTDMVNTFDYERFGQQIKYKYVDLDNLGTLSQTMIFELLAQWLSQATGGEKTHSEIVVSYYVQRCEVFSEIP